MPPAPILHATEIILDSYGETTPTDNDEEEREMATEQTLVGLDHTIPNEPRRWLWRSRWAAIGTALAVTFGGGGLFVANAASPQSVFVAISPTRVLDTRFDIGLVDAFQDGQARVLDVTGTVSIVLPGNQPGSAAPVPDGATAIVANVTVVGPTTQGFVSVRPGDATGAPATSNLNFQAGAVVPNSATVELASNGTINLFFSGTAASATADLLVDIVGYYVEGSGGTPGPKGDTGAQGDTGTTGDPGPSGAPGNDGADGIVGLQGLQGSGGTIAPNSATNGFVGPTANVSVDGTQRVFGSAEIPLAAASGNSIFRIGLCYQLGAGEITNFVGSAYSVARAGSDLNTYSASAASPFLAIGTYRVGLCVRNQGSFPLSTDFMNGWVAVTS